MQIAIDTSTDTAGLALVQDGSILAELTWHCGQNHTITLLPNLEHLLKGNQMSMDDVDCVIVARGPGSYNGLRVGVSTAKSIAFSLGVPIIGINTMEADAYQHAHTRLPVCPVFNAGREEIATATFKLKNGVWQQLAESRLTTVDKLCGEITEKTFFCGEFLPAVADELKKRLGDKAEIPTAAYILRRTGFLAELGLKRFKAADYDDAASLQPFYFRGPSISTPKHN